MVSGCIIPTELISRILGYTSARDVVRWRTVSLPRSIVDLPALQLNSSHLGRYMVVYPSLCMQVSKWFHAITYQLDVWKALHANVPFMPPPGLFLERALVKSERLAKSWSHQIQQLRVLSVHKIHFDGDLRSDSCHLVDGRWFIACQSERRFVLYDTNDTHPIIDKTHAAPPRVLWEQSDRIVRWVSSPGAYREGRWVVYVWLQFEHTRQCSLLELGWDADSGSLCDTVALDIPCDLPSESWPSNSSIKFKCPRFLYLRVPRFKLVFDTVTRIFYTVPLFKFALDQTRSSIPAVTPGFGAIITVELTNTHVICLHHYWIKERSKVIIAQAFTIPDDQRPVEMNGTNVLRLTHEGVFKSRDTVFNVIRNSVVDSLTGSVHVRLLERYQQQHHAVDDLRCIDLTLHRPSMDVLPMTITRQCVNVEGCIPVDMSGTEHWDISDEGYARCLFLAHDFYTMEPTGYPKPVVAKLAIDATGDRCVAVCGAEVEARTPEMFDLLTSVRYATKFDGTRGRFYDIRKGDHMFIVDVE